MNIKKEGGFFVHPLVIFYFILSILAFVTITIIAIRNYNQSQQSPTCYGNYHIMLSLPLIATGPWAE